VFVPGANQHQCERARVSCEDPNDCWGKKKAIKDARKAGDRRDRKLHRRYEAEIKHAAARIIGAITGSAIASNDDDAQSSDSYY
jgi:hypothetical protein